ncbi:MAG: hypothetical protein JRE64_12015 [Deltaproteobacteria bacterium]|nr:hypothetical protein [Deltaproteobacteria bacterium]
MNKIMKYTIFSVLTAIVLIPWSLNVAYAYETAPRISDREIIESLVELKQGQKNMNQRFEDMNQRFDNMNQSFNQRFENMNQSFNQRFEGMQNLMLALFGSAMAFVLGMLGYIIWDRKTAQQPFKRKLYNLENGFVEVEEQLEMKNPSGPVIARLVASFKQLAETDEKVAAILKRYSLL